MRAALSALGREGVIRSERGRGTFVVRRPRITYPIGRRTRFSTALEAQNSSGRLLLLRHARVAADAVVAEALRLAVGADVVMLETRGMAEETPISFATHWFDAARFADLPVHLDRTGSITRPSRPAALPIMYAAPRCWRHDAPCRWRRPSST